MNDANDKDVGDGGKRNELPMRKTESVALEPQRAMAEAPRQVSARDEADDEWTIDILGYWRVLLKHRLTVIAVTGSALLLAVMVTFLMTPMYRGTATLQIDREAMNIVQVEGLQPTETTSADFYQTQYELLRSRSLAERVAGDLALGDDPRFVRESTSLLASLRQMFSGSASDDDDFEARQERAISELRRHFSVEPVSRSRIVRIHYDHPDPEVARRVINGFAQAYITNNLDRRYEASSYARNFLEERIEQLKARLEEGERELVAYAQAQGIVNVDERQSLVGSKLSSINANLAEARKARVDAEALWNQVQRTEGFGLTQILDSRTFQENRRQRAALAAEYQNKLQLFRPAYPEMVQLQAQIDELDRQAQAEVDTIKASIQARYEAEVAREQTLEANLSELSGEVLALRERSIRYNTLQREVDTNQNLYNGLLQRYREIGVAGGVGTNNISIVDNAQRPGSPVSPNLKLNLALGLVGGLMLGVMSALGREYLDDTFKTPEDIETALGLPALGIIPRPASGVEIDEELKDRRSAISEAYRSLRTTLQFSTANGAPAHIVVTSARPSEGKSTTALSIARQFAQLGLNVLLVDADMRKPSLHTRLGARNASGLSNFLSGHEIPEAIVQRTDDEHLYFISTGPLPPNPAELLAGPRMLSLLSLAAQNFDLIVVDSPPVMGLADAPLLASVAEATLLVVSAGETRRDSARTALKRLTFARGQIVGALLNKFDAKQVGYGYGYGYGYGEDYHSYGLDQIAEQQDAEQPEAERPEEPAKALA